MSSILHRIRASLISRIFLGLLAVAFVSVSFAPGVIAKDNTHDGPIIITEPGDADGVGGFKRRPHDQLWDESNSPSGDPFGETLEARSSGKVRIMYLVWLIQYHLILMK